MRRRQQPSVGVVCAHNPGRRNLGMYSVDLSAARYFAGRGLPHRLLTYSGPRRAGELRYRPIAGPNAYAPYPEIVFWGDFQQNPVWGVRNHAIRLMRRRGMSSQDALEAWKRRFLLDGVPLAAGQRVYSIGTCFLGARTALAQAGLEEAQYRDLLSRFTAIAPRDDASFRELSELGLSNLLHGFDCASLLDLPRAEPRSTGRLAYAFGRTFRPWVGTEIANTVAEALALQPVPVDWLLPKYRLKGRARAYREALDVLRGVDFLVTDIYHLTINALNVGCPVSCIGRVETSLADTCDDQKKLVLAEMLGLGEQYIGLPADAADPAAVAAEAVIQRRRAPVVPEDGLRERARTFREALDRLWEGR